MKAIHFGLILLVASIQVRATPVYLTFEGIITHTSLVPSFYDGMKVKQVWMYDLEQDGYGTRNGIREYRVDDATRDYFYVEIVGGNVIPEDMPPSIYYSFNYGSNLLEYGTSHIAGSNADLSGHDEVWTAGRGNGLIVDWEVGDMFTIDNWSRGIGTSTAGYSMTLTEISTTNPYEAVPEPSSIVLFGLGTMGLGMFVCFRKSRVSA